MKKSTKRKLERKILIIKILLGLGFISFVFYELFIKYIIMIFKFI